MERTFAMGTSIARSRSTSIARLIGHLGPQGLNLRILDFKGHPVLCLVIPQVNINLGDDLDAMTIFIADEPNPRSMMV